MAVQFTRLGKEIAIAVKEGGPHPEKQRTFTYCHPKREGRKYA